MSRVQPIEGPIYVHLHQRAPPSTSSAMTSSANGNSRSPISRSSARGVDRRRVSDAGINAHQDVVTQPEQHSVATTSVLEDLDQLPSNSDSRVANVEVSPPAAAVHSSTVGFGSGEVRQQNENNSASAFSRLRRSSVNTTDSVFAPPPPIAFGVFPEPPRPDSPPPPYAAAPAPGTTVVERAPPRLPPPAYGDVRHGNSRYQASTGARCRSRSSTDSSADDPTKVCCDSACSPDADCLLTCLGVTFTCVGILLCLPCVCLAIAVGVDTGDAV